MKIGGTNTIDFARVSKFPKFVIDVKSRDRKRAISLILLENNTPINLNNYTVTVAAKKSDGNDIFNDVTVVDAKNGICEVEVTEQMLALDTDLPCEIVLYGEDGTVATSSNFVIGKISSVRDENSIISSSEFTGLTKALSEVKNIDNRFKEVNSQLEHKANQTELKTVISRLDNIVANSSNTEGNTELIDARVGSDGEVYTNVGDNIRSVAKGCVEKSMFTSCFRNTNPSYKSGKPDIYGDITLNLKSFIKNIVVKNCPEDVVLGVGMVLKNETQNTISIYKCINGKPIADYGCAVYPKLTNDRQYLTTKLYLDGAEVTVDVVVENWNNVEYHESRGIPYSTGGLSAKSYFNVAYVDDLNNEIAKVHTHLGKVLDNNYEFIRQPIFTSCFSLDDPAYTSSQGAKVHLKDYIVDLKIEGIKDDVTKCCIGRVAKDSSSTRDIIGVFHCRADGSPDGSSGLGVYLHPSNTNEEQLLTAKGKLGTFPCTVTMVVKNWADLHSQDTKNIHSKYSQISPKTYVKSNFNLVTNTELELAKTELKEDTKLQVNPKKFKNHSLLEQLFVDLQLIGFDETDRISVGMVRKNYTNNNTRPVSHVIGIYGLDSNDMADANQMIFGINFTESEANDTRVRKVIRSTFNGKKVEIRATINWSLIQGEEYAMPGLGAFSISGINNHYYINDYTDMIKALDTDTKNYVLLSSKTKSDIPIISFVDDDGNSKFLTKSKPIYDKHNVKCTVAVITNSVSKNNGLTLSDLKTLNSEGYEIVSHTHTHGQTIYKPGVATATDEEIELDIKKSFDYLKENGLETDTIVWAWGGYSDPNRYIRLAKKYFKYGVNASGGVMKEEVFNDMYYKRSFINKSTSLDTYKALIDDCYTNNGWLIFGTHSGSDTEIDSTLLDEIVSYVKSKNIQVMTVKEANKIKGNICSLGIYGEKGNSLYIGRKGIILN